MRKDAARQCIYCSTQLATSFAAGAAEDAELEGILEPMSRALK